MLTPCIFKLQIPGINVPFSQGIYILCALLISAIVHEIGHGIAAANEGLEASESGIFLFLFMPGAYVNISNFYQPVSSSSSSSLSDQQPQSGDIDNPIQFLWPPSRQLRIYCAGAWHNIVLCLVTLLIIFLLPYILFPFFYHCGKSGVFIDHVQEVKLLIHCL